MRIDRTDRLAAALVAGLALAIAAGPASAAKPAYVGKWASNLAECRLPADTLDAPVHLGRTTYDQYETHCDFRNIVGGKGVWSMKARCVSAGDVSRLRLTIWATAKLVTLKWSDSKKPDNMVRCR